jgi:hypothetical protein
MIDKLALIRDTDPVTGQRLTNHFPGELHNEAESPARETP